MQRRFDVGLIVCSHTCRRSEVLGRLCGPSTAAAAGTDAGKLWSLIFNGHESSYDWETLSKALRDAGFSKVERRSFRKGHPQILKETIDMQPELSLFVEASND